MDRPQARLFDPAPCRARGHPRRHARDTFGAEEGMAMPVATDTKVWTLEELHSLPDDGNSYELVHGELFVTPPPAVSHEEIVARLTRILVPFVAAHHIGNVYH